MNRLLFGDNLKWLADRKVFPDESVDLVYLDPPFNSNANYSVLFKEASGAASQAQFHAFTDTWEWTREVDDTYRQFVDIWLRQPTLHWGRLESRRAGRYTPRS